MGRMRVGRPRLDGARQAAALLAAAVLLVVTACGQTTTASSGDGLVEGAPMELQPAALPEAVESAVQAVSHRVGPGPDGALAVGDGAYHARFDAAGVALSLRDGAGRFQVATTSIRRGGHAIAVEPGDWRPDGPRARRPLSRGISEQVTASTGSVEWDVVLERPTAGDGDLEVDAVVSGATGPPRRLGDDWLWPVGDAEVRVGELVVADAEGEELHRSAPVAHDDGLRLSVPAATLEGAAYPVTLDPVVSPEYPVAAPVSGGAPDIQVFPSVAFNGTVFLAVWRSFGSESTSEHQIYGARITPAGVVLDPEGIAISTAPESQSSPDVASAGGGFFVVWDDRRNADVDVRGTRVTGAGAVLDPEGIVLNTTSGQQLGPRIESNGTGYLVGWENYTGGGQDPVRATRVDADGTVLDPAGITIGVGRDLALAHDGTNWFAAFVRSPAPNAFDLYGARIDAGGAVLDPAGVPISTAAGNQSAPAVAYGGGTYLVGWYDDRAGSANADIYGALVGTGGTVTSGDLLISGAAGAQASPEVAFDGTNFYAAWSDRRNAGQSDDVYGSRIAPNGTVLDPAGTPIVARGNTQERPAIAFDGTRLLVVWQDGRFASTSRFDIFGARVDGAGSVVDPNGILLSTALGTQGAQTASVISFDGGNHLVASREDRGDGGDIYASRVRPDGTSLDGAGRPVSTAGGDQSAPSSAFGGGNHLVVWQDRRSGTSADVYAARVAPTGTVLDAGGIPVAAGTGEQTAPDVAFDGTDFVVVWTDDRSGSPDVVAARVGTDGVVLDPAGITVSSADGAQVDPSVASRPGESLVVWEDARAGGGDVYAARIGSGGLVLDPTLPVTGGGIRVSAGPLDERDPAVGWNGNRWLAAWADDRSGTSSDVYGARLSTLGVVEDPAGFAISSVAGDQDAPDVTFNGVFLVAWRDGRSGGGTDAYASRVADDGTVRDGAAGVAVSTGPGDEGPPSVVGSGGIERFGVAYARVATSAPFDGISRSWYRSFSK